MGGAVKQFGDWVGETVKGKPKAAPAPAAAPQPAAAPRAGVDVPSEAQTDMAARRRARRGTRALLSEARLSPEEGIGQTLGAGPM